MADSIQPADENRLGKHPDSSEQFAADFASDSWRLVGEFGHFHSNIAAVGLDSGSANPVAEPDLRSKWTVDLVGSSLGSRKPIERLAIGWKP